MRNGSLSLSVLNWLGVVLALLCPLCLWGVSRGEDVLKQDLDPGFIATSISMTDNHIVMGGRGEVRVYNREGINWSLQDTLQTSTDLQAYSTPVAISGDRIAFFDHKVNRFRIYQLNGDTWESQYESGVLNFEVDAHIAFSGDYLALGQKLGGKVYVFKRNGNSWASLSELTAPNPHIDLYYGYSIALSNDYLVVGSPGSIRHNNTVHSGAVFVYKLADLPDKGPSELQFVQHYSQWASLDGYRLGESVAVSDDYIAVGSKPSGKLGSTCVFRKESGNWTLSDTVVGSMSGHESSKSLVAISRQFLLVYSSDAFLYDMTNKETILILDYSFHVADYMAISDNYFANGGLFPKVYDMRPYLAATTPANSFTSSSVVSGGELRNKGISPNLEKWVCWSKVPNPTLNDSKLQSQDETKSFKCVLANLEENTTYYAKAYCTSDFDTVYGDEISFTTLKSAPIGQASHITFSDVECDSLNIQWASSGTASGFVILARAGSAVDANPVDGFTYNNANAAFGSGDRIGTGNYVIYMGTGDSVTVTGLIPTTTYHFRVYEFSLNSAGMPNYNTSTASANPSSQLTTAPDLTVTTTGFVAGFGEVEVNSSSDASTFSVSGERLMGDVTIEAPEGFEVASDDDDFSSSISLTPTDGEVDDTTIYVRFAPTEAKDYSGNVTVETSHITTTNIAVSGKGIVAPTLETSAVADLKCLSATLGGNLVADGNSNSIQVGVCWGTAANPTIGDSKIDVETVTGPKSYTALASNLNFGTTYHVRAYASNNAGVVYGEDVTFSTPTPTITVSALGNMGKVVARSFSPVQSYTISGPALMGAIQISAPDGFEVSLTGENDSFTSSLTIETTDDKVVSTVIYVRFGPIEVKAYSGNITHSSLNAETKSVAVSGEGLEREDLRVPEDYATVAAALAAAYNGDDIVISGTHTECDIYIDKDVTIRGEGADASIVQGSESIDEAFMRVFTVEAGVTATISDITIRNGKEFHFGGGIYNGGILTLTRCRITGNSALFGGGIASEGKLLIEDCCVDGNTAIHGGGVFNDTGQIIMENSTFTGNNASYGGGLYVYQGAIGIDSCTIAGNSAVEVGGGVFNDDEDWDDFALIVMKNTIVGDNTALIFPDIYGEVTSEGNNLVENMIEMILKDSTDTDIYYKDPLLMALSEYGGPVPTMALKSGSPALGAGSTELPVDGRGVTRPQGSAADIGAFESRVFTVTFTAGENGTISGETSQSVQEWNDCSVVKAVPNQDFHFQSWTRNGTIYRAEEALLVSSVSEDMAFTANFSQDTFHVIFKVEGPGTLEGETSQAKKHGEICSVVRAVSSDEGHFVKWIGSNGEEYMNSSLIFGPVVTSIELTAHFSSVQYTIKSTSGDGGSISPSGDVVVAGGASATFAVTPDSGYYLKQVLVDGISVGAVPSYTFKSVEADHTISAEFAKVPAEMFVITATSGEGGSVSPSGVVTVPPSGSAGFVIEPDTGYLIKDVLVDGTSIGAVQSHIFSEVDGNHTIKAEFSKEIAVTHTITATATEGGTISPAGTIDVTDGGNITFTLKPNAGYQVKRILVDRVSVGAASSFRFKNVSSNHTIHAEFTNSLGELFIVTSKLDGQGGLISPLGAIPVEKGDDLTFAITPDTGYRIFDVLVDGTSIGSVESYTFKSVGAKHALSASFAEISYFIKASSDENGSISPSDDIQVNYGDTQTFEFTAKAGYYLKNVIVDNVSVGAASSYTFKNIKSDHEIHAEFAKLEVVYHMIKATAGAGGTISPSGEVSTLDGGSVKFVITPNDAYMIKDVFVDSSSIGTVEEYTFEKVTKDHAIHAEFSTIPVGEHVIIASATTGGEIKPDGHITIKDGETATFSMSPSESYVLKDVLVDSVSVGAVSSYVFSNVIASHRIQAVYAKKTYRLSVTVGEGGSVSPSGDILVESGEKQLLVFTPDSGWQVKDVIIDGTSFGILAEYEFTNVRSDHSVKVEFSKGTANLFVIKATSSNGGTVSPEGRITVKEKDSISFIILPEYDKRIKDVEIDGVSVGAVENYTFSEISANHTLAAYFEDDESTPEDHCLFGIKMSDPSGGWLYPKGGKYHVPKGVALTLEVIPGDKHVFKGWKIMGEAEMADPNSRKSMLTINGDTEVLAIFEHVVSDLSNTIYTSSVIGGKTTPSGSTIVKAGEEQGLSATAQNGFIFKEWLITKGTVTIESPESSDTYATLLDDSGIMAVFIKPEMEITATLSVDGYGIVEPSGKVSVPVGSAMAITAKAAAGQRFLRWQAVGGATIINPNASEARAVLTGDCEITALFAEESDTVSLTINESDSSNPIVEYYLKGESRTLSAKVPVYKAFQYWDCRTDSKSQMSGHSVSPLENIYASNTTLSVYDNLLVDARFVKNEMTVEQARKAFVVASLKKSGRDLDKIRINRFPCDVSDFNPETDSVTLRINGQEFVFEQNTFKQLGKRRVWKGYSSSADGHPRLIIDLEDGSWSFKGAKMSLSQLVSARELNISLSLGSYVHSCRVLPKVLKKYCFNHKKGDKVATARVVGDEFAEFKVANILLQYGADKEKENKLAIPKFSFVFPNESGSFNSNTESLELRINNISIIAPPGSFKFNKNGWQVFHDQDKGFAISLNLTKGEGKFIINQLKKTGFEIESDQFDISLRLGDYSGALKMYPGKERTILKWGK